MEREIGNEKERGTSEVKANVCEGNRYSGSPGRVATWLSQYPRVDVQ